MENVGRQRTPASAVTGGRFDPQQPEGADGNDPERKGDRRNVNYDRRARKREMGRRPSGHLITCWQRRQRARRRDVSPIHISGTDNVGDGTRTPCATAVQHAGRPNNDDI